MQHTAAYDLDAFAAHAPRQRLRVAPAVPRRGLFNKANLRYVRWIAFGAVLISLVASVICSQISVTELSAQIARQQSDLADLQSEHTYLSNEMEMKTSLKNVEEYAKTQLGLVKLDKSQITYVERTNEDVIVRPASDLEKVLGSVSTSVMSFMEYLAP